MDMFILSICSHQSSPNGTKKQKTMQEGNEEEKQYLSLIENILSNGTKREDRTGTGNL